MLNLIKQLNLNYFQAGNDIDAFGNVDCCIAMTDTSQH